MMFSLMTRPDHAHAIKTDGTALFRDPAMMALFMAVTTDDLVARRT